MKPRISVSFLSIAMLMIFVPIAIFLVVFFVRIEIDVLRNPDRHDLMRFLNGAWISMAALVAVAYLVEALGKWRRSSRQPESFDNDPNESGPADSKLSGQHRVPRSENDS